MKNSFSFVSPGAPNGAPLVFYTRGSQNILSATTGSGFFRVHYMVDDKKSDSRIVNLSLDDIAEALDNCTFDTRYILDLHNQEIIMLSEYLMSDDEIQEVFNDVDEDETGRYVLFPIRTDARDEYQDMERFIDEIKDPEMQTSASLTIRGSGAFRRFKDFIRNYPDLEKQWYAWKDTQSRDRAQEWLEEEGLNLIRTD